MTWFSSEGHLVVAVPRWLLVATVLLVAAHFVLRWWEGRWSQRWVDDAETEAQDEPFRWWGS